jgi:hypothetical protein
MGVHRSVAQINSGAGEGRAALIGAAGVLGSTMILGGLAKGEEAALHCERRRIT